MTPPSTQLLLLALLTLTPPVVAQGGAIEFSGGFLTIPNHSLVQSVGKRATIEAWVRAPKPGTYYIFTRYSGSREHRDLGITPNGAITFEYAGSPWAHGLSTKAGVFPFDCKWHHVAFVRHLNDTYEIYVDGIAVHSGGPGPCWLTCNIITTTTPTIVGSGQVKPFDPWSMAALRFSSVDRYSGSFTPATSWTSDGSTALLMNFDEGKGATTRDSGPAKLVGQLSGSYRWISSVDFTQDKASVSLSQGGVVSFCLRVPEAHAGKLYLVLGSLSGTNPGIMLGALNLPLNVDPYFVYTLTDPNGIMQGSLGFLSRTGEASARLSIAPGSPPALVGRKMNHAYVIFGRTHYASFHYTSSATSLDLVK